MRLLLVLVMLLSCASVAQASNPVVLAPKSWANCQSLYLPKGDTRLVAVRRMERKLHGNERIVARVGARYSAGERAEVRAHGGGRQTWQVSFFLLRGERASRIYFSGRHTVVGVGEAPTTELRPYLSKPRRYVTPGLLCA